MRVHKRLRESSILLLPVLLVVLAYLSLLVLPIAQAQQEMPAPLTVIVRDALSGSPLAGIPIEVRQGDKETSVKETDRNGTAAFDLPAGSYTVRAHFLVLHRFKIPVTALTVDLGGRPYVVNMSLEYRFSGTLQYVLLAAIAGFIILGIGRQIISRARRRRRCPAFCHKWVGSRVCDQQCKRREGHGGSHRCSAGHSF